MSRKDRCRAPRFTVMQVMVKFCGEHDVFDLGMITQAIRKFDRKDRPFDKFLCHEPCGVEQEEGNDLRLTQPAVKFRLVRGNVWYYACLECIKDGKGGCRQVLCIVNGSERRKQASPVWWNGHERGTDPRNFLKEKDLPRPAEQVG